MAGSALDPGCGVDATGIDSGRLDAFAGRFVGDLGVALHLATVLVGDRLGLYEAMADLGPVTPAELAEHTGLDERYLTEWLAAQAAAGYTDHAHGRFRLPPEHALLLVDRVGDAHVDRVGDARVDRGGPVLIPAAFQVAAAVIKSQPAVTEAFRTGRGVGWHEHDPDLFAGCARFLRREYAARLVTEWLPALDGVVADLERGATVADIGCGFGAGTILMAGAFPNSTFVGSDPHGPSVRAARQAARTAGVADRVSFEIEGAQSCNGSGLRLATTFACLHHMGDPVGAGRHVRSALAENGTWMIVEPYAGHRFEDNLTPVGAAFYALSTMVCTPASRAQAVGRCLGAQAGEAGIAEVVREAGFTRFRRVAQTPLSIVYEARR